MTLEQIKTAKLLKSCRPKSDYFKPPGNPDYNQGRWHQWQDTVTSFANAYFDDDNSFEYAKFLIECEYER